MKRFRLACRILPRLCSSLFLVLMPDAKTSWKISIKPPYNVPEPHTSYFSEWSHFCVEDTKNDPGIKLGTVEL